MSLFFMRPNFSIGFIEIILIFFLNLKNNVIKEVDINLLF